MNRITQWCLVAALGAAIAGCGTLEHYVADDYARYLAKNYRAQSLPLALQRYDYALTAPTAGHLYELATPTTPGNLWIVKAGQMLEATLQSKEVQEAFGRLEKAKPGAASENRLVFELLDYAIVDQAASVRLKVSQRAGEAERFTKVYAATGKPQGGKMFWGSVFATKNAIHQSTRTALDQILKELIDDLNRNAA